MLPMLAGNWKMNGTRASVHTLLSQLKDHRIQDGVQIVVFPPFPFLQQASEQLHNTSIAWGAQTICVQENGAFTGEVSATMLVDFGCRFVIVGHSERRALFGEGDELIARKCQKALEHGLTPILCVGETRSERENGLTEQVVSRQLFSVLEIVGVEAFAKIVLAYEPVWAIGTGLTASCEEAEAVHAFLAEKVAEKNAEVAKGLQILYGGSLKASNARALFAMPHIGGGLVGGASLEGKEFLEMADMLASRK